jgi:hypothetical protein
LWENSDPRREDLQEVDEPVWRRMKNVPSTSPTSPTTLMTNALMPAAVAVVRRYQNEIRSTRRADERPADDQKKKFAARTSSSMLKTKKFR